ncbi:MAG: glycosyltransferase family 4 protein [Candidatus Goldiibacteriota bacterium]|jgi:glycosyltransferase involved in cell wall biosynthesis
MEINYFGLLRSLASWAKAGRCITAALIEAKDRVHVYERRGFLYDPAFDLGPAISGSLTKSFPAEATLTFEHPINYRHITSPLKYGMLVYESTAIPADWPEIINNSLNLVLVPSQFNREAFISSGVIKGKIRVLPHGIDEKIYNSTGRPGKNGKFIFLCAAMPQKRKALDKLLKAFKAAFGDGQDVELAIKLPYAPGKTPYDDLTIREYYNEKNIKFIFSGYDENEMARLYKNADCFVLASRGEGFGMVYLEALACGAPVIAAGWGGQTDFLNDTNSLLVKYSLGPAGSMQYGSANPKGLMAEPDFDDLVSKLRYARKNPEIMEKKVSAFDVSKYTWAKTALTLKSILSL